MALLTLLSFYFFALSLSPTTTAQSCRYTCPGGKLPLRFPFGINGTAPNSRCSYPGFALSCDGRNQTILTLPNSGQFVVQYINYEEQVISLTDPAMCLPNRFLKSFNLSVSPFGPVGFTDDFTFLSCPRREGVPPPTARLIRCLSSENRSVVAVRSAPYYYGSLFSSCSVIRRVEVPALWPYSEDSIELTWYSPDCSDCEQRGGTCGFRSARGLAFGCSRLPRTGIPRSAKYGLIIGVGIPGLLCLIGLACCLCGKRRNYGRQGHNRDVEFPPSMIPQPIVFVTGLDGSIIESYPKTLIGESRRLPKPNDNICPICLCEYQPKETLRTIPECNHYFHAVCIDEWLRMNGSCPVCRNSPGGSALVTPSETGSSSTSSRSLVSSP